MNQPLSGSRLPITGACYSAMAFLGIGFAIVGVAAQELGLNAAQVGILIAFQQAGFAFGVVSAGMVRGSRARARMLALGCLVLASCLLLFYRAPTFWVNALLMSGIGVGMGSFEGTTDALLIQVYEGQHSRHININHFFVTIGATGITAYLMFWPLDWRSSLNTIGIGSFVVALLFFVVRLPVRNEAPKGGSVFAGLPSVTMMAPLFALGVLVVGAELGAMGFLPLYLVQVQGMSSTESKAALLLLLVGVATGRMLMGILVGDRRLGQALLGASSVATVTMALLFAVRHVHPGVLFLLAFLAGIGIAGTLPLMLARGSALSGGDSSRTIAILKLCIPVGGMTVPAVLARASQGSGLSLAVLLIPACTLLASVIAYFTSRSLNAIPLKATMT